MAYGSRGIGGAVAGLLLSALVSPSAGGGESVPDPDSVVVCLGDSVTDGNTWPQIVAQTLGERAPVLICSGAGGDTLEAMLRRFDRDVAAFRPGVVAMLSGVNDAMAGVTPEAFATHLRTLAAKGADLGARVVLMTPIVIRPVAKNETDQTRIDGALALLERYDEQVAALGRELDLPVAPVRAFMASALAAGETSLWVEDGIHPDKRGQALIARALLAAFGVDAPTPSPLRFRPYPGLIRRWRVDTGGDGSGAEHVVPEPLPADADPEEWAAQMRANGFAMGLEERWGGGRHRVRAVLPSTGDRDAWLHLGGGVKSLTLNGQPLSLRTGWAGYHAGYDRIPVTLRAGDNGLEAVVEGLFLVLLTPDRIWERSASDAD